MKKNKFDYDFWNDPLKISRLCKKKGWVVIYHPVQILVARFPILKERSIKKVFYDFVNRHFPKYVPNSHTLAGKFQVWNKGNYNEVYASANGKNWERITRYELTDFYGKRIIIDLNKPAPAKALTVEAVEEVRALFNPQ